MHLLLLPLGSGGAEVTKKMVLKPESSCSFSLMLNFFYMHHDIMKNVAMGKI